MTICRPPSMKEAHLQRATVERRRCTCSFARLDLRGVLDAQPNHTTLKDIDMTDRITLRMLPGDLRSLAAAAEIIAGPAGAAYVRPTTIIRKALAAFIATRGAASTEATAR